MSAKIASKTNFLKKRIGEDLYAIKQKRASTLQKLVSLSEITSPVSEDLISVERHIVEQLSSDVKIIKTMGEYLISAGGKKLRPITLLLATKALNYRGTDHITLAAVIELIHTATLIHDDVVDKSQLRRGKETINEVWGNAASVLVGDFVYSRSFAMMVTVNRLRVMEIMASTTNAIAEGEVMQLYHANLPQIDEQAYLATIQRNTARLFQAATQLAAILAGADAASEAALIAFGFNIGLAFQISDDLLDYSQKPTTIGKNPGDDLADGKCTLPLIHALKNASNSSKKLIRTAIENGDRTKFNDILEIIESTGSVKYASKRSIEFAETAKSHLGILPDSIFRKALLELADFSARRIY